jgi:hypothetical protein
VASEWSVRGRTTDYPTPGAPSSALVSNP